MFLKTYYLINKNPFTFETKLKSVINFMNEFKHAEFEKAQNKRFWLMEELNLPESYFWNTYIEDPDIYISEKDNEYLTEKEYEQSDKFDIK